MRLMRTCPQAIICNVHGYAMGAGLSLTLASDMRLASPDAVFCAQYINIGVGGADLGSAYFLPRLVGWGKTVEMCMTGDRIPAEEAHRIGLVNHIYEKDQLMEQARALAYNLLSKTKLGLSLTKEALNSGLNLNSLEEVNKLENRNQAFMLFANYVTCKRKSDLTPLDLIYFSRPRVSHSCAGEQMTRSDFLFKVGLARKWLSPVTKKSGFAATAAARTNVSPSLRTPVHRTVSGEPGSLTTCRGS